MSYYGYYEQTAFGVINAYLWEDMQSAGILGSYAWTPIIPAQQVPEFVNLNPDKPFIVYTATIPTITTEWFYNEESITYEIFGKEDEIRKIVNYLVDVLRRYDETAYEINQWAITSSNARHIKFNFKHVEVVAALFTDPSEQEGGRNRGIVSIRYAYTTPLEQNGRRTLL